MFVIYDPKIREIRVPVPGSSYVTNLVISVLVRQTDRQTDRQKDGANKATPCEHGQRPND